jgi:hypothetical protein
MIHGMKHGRVDQNYSGNGFWHADRFPSSGSLIIDDFTKPFVSRFKVRPQFFMTSSFDLNQLKFLRITINVFEINIGFFVYSLPKFVSGAI